MPWFEIQHQASQSDPLKDVKPNPTVLTRMHRLVIDCLSGPNSRALEPWFLRKRRAAPSVLHPWICLYNMFFLGWTVWVFR